MPSAVIPRRFTAATWNVNHATALTVLEPIVADLADRGVTVLLLQEARQQHLPVMLAGHGYLSVRSGGQVAAWREDTWVAADAFPLRLASANWFYSDGKPAVSTAAVAVLCDHQGRTITAASYHLPPAVQARGRPTSLLPRRLRVTRQSVETLKALAGTALTRARLFGGDDNVDESRGPGWEFMLRAATGLRQVQAPDPTLGSRRIDDFRVNGLLVRAGYTLPGGGDHRLHAHAFGWAAATT